MSGIRKLQFRATVSTLCIMQRVCRTMATSGDESVVKKQSETEKSGGPGGGGMIRVEELQAINWRRWYKKRWSRRGGVGGCYPAHFV